MDPHPPSSRTARRGFLKSAGALAAVSALPFPHVQSAEPDGRRLKIGLVGCGGRGSGAAADALTADSGSEVFAAADVLPAQIDQSLSQLKNKFGERINVPPDRRHVGLEAFQQVIEQCDVVILATPPGFRPQHFAAAVEAGRHVFCEKPMAVDSAGVRQLMESVRLSREKNLCVVGGFCWRYARSRQQLFEAVHQGAIGDVTGYYATYLTSPVKPMPRASERQPEWSDVEWQVRNWYNFSWLSGDGYVEQCIHSVDKVAWAMKDQPPIACTATGGRQFPAEGGNIYDHMTVVYEYPNSVFCTVAQRQIPGCYNENADTIQGTKGHALLGRGAVIRGENARRFREEDDSMYVEEHRELFKAIRSGAVINDGERMASSTLLGLMGRLAAYTGQRVTWEQALNSPEDLAPDTLGWNDSFTPMERPVPGQYRV